MNERKLICIGCPKGCPVTVTLEDGTVKEVNGYGCRRGKAYAEKEVTNPTRIVTTTVRVSGGELAVVSVKTKEDIPKSRMMDCIQALRGLVLQAPVHIGDIVLADAAGTGVPVVATKQVNIVSKTDQ